MASHSSILAWEIPWTKEPGGLQTMESQSCAADTAQQLNSNKFPETGLQLLLYHLVCQELGRRGVPSNEKHIPGNCTYKAQACMVSSWTVSRRSKRGEGKNSRTKRKAVIHLGRALGSGSEILGVIQEIMCILFLYSDHKLLDLEGKKISPPNPYSMLPTAYIYSSKHSMLCLQHRRPRLDPWVGKIAWRRTSYIQATPVFCPGESHGLAGYSSRGRKSQTLLSD